MVSSAAVKVKSGALSPTNQIPGDVIHSDRKTITNKILSTMNLFFIPFSITLKIFMPSSKIFPHYLKLIST